MGVRATSAGTPRVLNLDTLVRLRRGLRTSRAGSPQQLAVPEGMQVPLGCDAVAVPARFGPLLMPRLPRVGCVYADGTQWWWLVPSDSDVSLEWPAPAHYATGAVVHDAPRQPDLIHKPDSEIPYTPPIPLYLALCRIMGAAPSWSRPVST
ncbi:hypothetical protein [Streptomyces sporangiiformans]|uniref:Uncharacterized protein n=1 Tax=Streptomyces sporangiiformans TaxID=2315329 RepID=A0A505DDV7_9ACTN|nr:hypothetical protein [Streptomyces sporangiiformans]TPQ21934.1 hypothetical protein FGD71_012370 [Streptomyces sporangiiformans]